MKEVSVINFKGTAGKRQIKDKISREAISVKKTVGYNNPVIVTDALPVSAVSLKTTINAIQDLHGYDKPWAGGAGKNKVNLVLSEIISWNDRGTWNGNAYTYNGCTFTVDVDAGTITKRGTATEQTQFFTNALSLPAESYKLSGCPSGGSYSTYDIRYTNDYIDLGNGASFVLASASSDVRLAMTIRSGNSDTVVYKPMITLASVSDSDYAHFAPYSNICPISGRTAVVITRTGENISTGVESGAFGTDGVNNANPNRCRTVGYVPLDSNKHYLAQSNVSNLYIAVSYYASNVSGIERISGTGWESLPYSFTPPNGCHYVRCLFSYNSGAQTVINPIDLSDFMLLEDATDFTIQLGQTVYGADINWGTGMMTVLDAIVDMGNLTYQYDSGTNSMTSAISGAKPPANDSTPFSAISSICPIIAANERTTVTGIRAYVFGGYTTIYIRDSGYTDPTAFKTAMTGQKICYELAEPIELTLTPTEVQMLKGYNRVTIDNGTIQLKYLADRIQALETALAQLMNS